MNQVWVFLYESFKFYSLNDFGRYNLANDFIVGSISSMRSLGPFVFSLPVCSVW
jgi:hypothetical protein